jgi:SpoVK/Ycf46/Vps4 family AAA+-type ATPase
LPADLERSSGWRLLSEREARAHIFDIHFGRRGQDRARFDLDRLATLTDGFSGAEIEQAIV